MTLLGLTQRTIVYVYLALSFAAYRQGNDKRGALAHFGVHRQRAAVFFHHDIVRDRQPQPCPFTDRLGREQMLKDPRLGRCIHTRAVVSNGDADRLFLE